MKNSILDIENDVAERIAQRTLAKREAGYASEVRIPPQGIPGMTRSPGDFLRSTS
jgi:hypothetical protein